jgi:hypothetical protein
MPHFVPPSEYSLMTVGQLQAEKVLLDSIAYVEEFFYLDNFADQLREYGPEIIRVLPSTYLARVVEAAKLSRHARAAIEVIDLEISHKL